MAASFPGAIKAFTTKTDGVDLVLAAHMNDVQAEVNAIETILEANPQGTYSGLATRLNTTEGGWNVDNGGPWSYVSATQVSWASGQDFSTKFPPGTKIRFVQSGANKYFYVASSSYAAPNFTLTLTGGTDFTVANSAITVFSYSYIANPQGFPPFFNFSPTFGGFSVNPTYSAQFSVVGRKVTAFYYCNANGTSNATTFTISLPITANANQIAALQIIADTRDNGSSLTTPGNFYIGSGDTVAHLFKANGGATWTAAGAKGASFTAEYFI